MSQYIRYPNSSSTTSSADAVASIGVFDQVPASANGALVGSGSIWFSSSTSTQPGMVSSAAQTFAGVKTFSSAPIISTASATAPVKTDGSKNLVSGSISLTADVTGILPAANLPPLSGITGSVSLTAQVSGVLPAANLPAGTQIGSVSLTNQVSGILPALNTQALSALLGSVSLTAQVSGVLPALNTQALSALLGSVSLTGQVSGVLPAANGGSTGSNTGDISLSTVVGTSPAAAGASLGAGQVLTLQPADATHPGVVSTASQVFIGAKIYNTSIASPTQITGSVTMNSAAGGNAYTWTLPASQGSASWVLQNDGAGALSWVNGITNPTTTKADIIVSSGTSTLTRLGVGTDGQVLLASSATSLGISWGNKGGLVQTYTPSNTQGLGSVSAATMTWQRSNGSLILIGKFNNGTTTASEARVELPFSLQASSVLPNTLTVVGMAAMTGVAGNVPVLIKASQTYVNFGSTGLGPTVPLNGNAFITGSNSSIHATIPIEGWI